MVEAVIFDMDGLMFDTECIWERGWAPACAAMGVSVHPQLASRCRGSAGENLLAAIRSCYGPQFDAKGLFQKLLEVTAEEFSRPVPKKPGLDELLTWLKEQHIPCAVASSSPREVILGNLRHYEMEHFFQTIVSGSEVAHSKPEPDIFLLAAQRLQVPPSRCLVLEDSHNGVRAGHAGGFITVMVPDLMPANGEMAALYSTKCDSLTEVLSLLQKKAL